MRVLVDWCVLLIFVISTFLRCGTSRNVVTGVGRRVIFLGIFVLEPPVDMLLHRRCVLDVGQLASDMKVN